MRVTVPSAQLPLPSGTVLSLQRTSAAGSIQSASWVATWGYNWPSSGLLEFFPTSTVTETSEFNVILTGPATWTATLAIPGGQTFT